MTVAAKLPILLAILLSLSAPRSAAAQNATALRLDYDFYALGLHAMTADIAFNLTPDAYRMELNLRTVGAVDLIAGGYQYQGASGTFAPGRVAPRQFVTIGSWRGKNRAAKLAYTDILPTVLNILPPIEGEREPVPNAMRERTIDAFSVLALLLRRVAETGRCEVDTRTFDGRRVVQYEARTAGNEDHARTGRSSFAGRALRCDFGSHMLAGFRTADNREADNIPRQGSIWLGEVAPGVPRLPVRMSFATKWFGDIAMYVTAIGPSAIPLGEPLVPRP